jgi:hypothetical protein
MSSVHAGSNWTSLDRCGGALQRSNWISHTWSQINKAPLHCDQGRTKKAVAVASLPLAAGQGTLMMAGALFTFGTAFVVPLYTTMVVAPHWDWTKKLAETSFPYMVLGALYIYLLSLSWTSETLRLMFSSKYWLPEVSGLICCGYSVQQTWVFVLGRHVQTWVMTMCLLQQPSQASRVCFGCNNKQEINLDSFTYRIRFFSFLSFQIVAVRYHTCCLVVG